MNSGTDIIRSTSSPQQQSERQTNTIKQPQNEQMASRVGNSFLKRWQLCYPNLVNMSKPLKRQSQLLSSALSSACDFKSHFCKQCRPRSDCSFRSSLIWVHTVCLYAKIGLKSLQEYSADYINRRHFQIQFFLVL